MEPDNHVIVRFIDVADGGAGADGNQGHGRDCGSGQQQMKAIRFSHMGDLSKVVLNVSSNPSQSTRTLRFL